MPLTYFRNFFKGQNHEGRTVQQNEFFIPQTEPTPTAPNSEMPFMSNNVIFNQIFANNKIMWKTTDLISPDEVLGWMQQLAQPLWGEFVEETDNEAFLDIADEFFKYLFFNGKLWVWYGAIGELEIDPADQDPLQETEEGLEEFLLLVKIKPDDLRDLRYMDIKTGKQLIMPEEAEPIEVKWRGLENLTLHLWFSVTYSFLIGRKIYENKRLLFGKTYTYTKIGSESRAKVENNLNTLSNLDPYFIQDANTGKLSELKFVESAQLRDFLFAEYQRLDRDLSELGRVANINDKHEKKTTGENYKDIHAVACRQRLVLNHLKSFCSKLQRRFGVELSFAVNGVLNKEDVHVDVEGNPLKPELGGQMLDEE